MKNSEIEWGVQTKSRVSSLASPRNCPHPRLPTRFYKPEIRDIIKKLFRRSFHILYVLSHKLYFIESISDITSSDDMTLANPSPNRSSSISTHFSPVAPAWLYPLTQSERTTTL